MRSARRWRSSACPPDARAESLTPDQFEALAQAV